MAATLTWPGKTNGKIPASFMRPIAKGKLMQPDAAVWFAKMNQALYAATGRRLTIGAEQDAYRDCAKQHALWDAHAADPEHTPSAAWPCTSNHGFGLAADVTGMTDTIIAAWMRENAAKYHYRIFRIKGEPWHIEYIGPITSLAGSGELIGEEEMNDIVNLVDTSTYKNAAPIVGTKCASILPTGKVFFYDRTLKKGEVAEQLAAKAGPHIECTHAQFIEWTTAPEAPPAGTVTLGTLKIETTGTIEPA